MQRAAFFGVTLCGLGLAWGLDAAEVGEAIPGTCVTQLDRGLGSGISTGNLVKTAKVLRCGNQWSALSVGSGKFVLRDLSGPLSAPLNEMGSELIGIPLADPAALDHYTDWVVAPRRANRILSDAQPTLVVGTLAAWLIHPTDIYRHGILGDQVEASGFHLGFLRVGGSFNLTLPPGSVFEDLRVRLVDLTGDGQTEFVVIRSYLDRGAALAFYRLVDGKIEHLAETPPIGIANRWLNPAGAADFDGDGRVEIAYVETPHIGGTLRVWELVDGELRQEQAVAGFSNHAIGSRELDLSAVLDWNGDGVPDLAVPANGRRSLRIVSFAGGEFSELDTVPHDAEIVTAILATDLDADGKPELLYGLEDGRLMLARP